ncbi:hypothetical protein ACFW1A_34680, partial [Kitasatospora sp. NPDC058965]|uniref:hypothetical protein n=1 Tax=Kitasatospora sp. NPDC058965 TaxID=3346682 RepID=UPI003699B6FF
MPTTHGRLAVEAGYVAAIAALAVLGGVRHEPVYYLTAVALSLPLGGAALIGMYGGYGLLAQLGGAFAAGAAPDGTPAAWLTWSSSVLDVVLLTAAAVGNVLLLRRRGRRSGSAAGGPVPGRAP